MKFQTSSALFFAASIALAIAAPARQYYRPVSYEEGDESLIPAGEPYTLGNAPFFYSPRTLELDGIPNRGRKYKVVKRKKGPDGRPIPGSDEDEDDEPQDEEDDESSEEEADEEGGGGDNEEEEFDTPPWEELFPEEDKNTGNFEVQGDQGAQGGYGGQGQGGQGGYGGQGGQGGYGGSLANLPGGAPAPESSGSLMNFFGGGSSEQGPDGPGGPQGGGGGGGPPQYRQGPPPSRPAGPPRRREGPPPSRPYQAVRSRSSLIEEPRTGGAVLYDGHRYIPVRPVNVRIPQRQAKTIKKNAKSRPAKPTVTPVVRQNKKLPLNKQYVVVPVDRDSREIRFSRDQHGFKVENGPMYAPSEIWRWEGPSGRPLRRRENRPVFYTSRPQRGSSVRFAQEDDY